MQHIPDVEQRGYTKRVVTPLVGARHKGSNETGDDEDDAHEECREDVGQRQTGGEEELKEQERECDEPLDVTHELCRGWVRLKVSVGRGANIPKSDGCPRP